MSFGRSRFVSRECGIGGLLVLTCFTAGIVNSTFFSVSTLLELLVQCAPLLIVGCGVTLVILTGEIDISVGSLFGLMAAVMGTLSSPSRMGWNSPTAIGATLLVGAGVGLLNGLLVTFGRVPSILATLGMMTILRGLTEQVLGGEWITDVPHGLRVLGTGTALGVPVSLWVGGACVVWMMVLAGRTRAGRGIHAVGDNIEAAALSGLRVRSLKLLAFVITGLLTAVAALVGVPQLAVIDSGLGVGLELFVVTAVVVGGTSIRGGAGTIVGTVLAVLLLGSIRTVLVFLKLGDSAIYWERAIQGVFILAAVVLDRAAPSAAGRSPGTLATRPVKASSSGALA